MTTRNEAPRRREFLRFGGVAIVAAAVPGIAAAQARVEENDPQASALGYRNDTTKVDKAKFPKHTADQKCSGCQLFQGKPGDATGPCAIFPGKVVSSTGWCSAWSKKAA